MMNLNTHILSGRSLFDADYFEGLDRHEMEAEMVVQDKLSSQTALFHPYKLLYPL